MPTKLSKRASGSQAEDEHPRKRQKSWSPRNETSSASPGAQSVDSESGPETESDLSGSVQEAPSEGASSSSSHDELDERSTILKSSTRESGNDQTPASKHTRFGSEDRPDTNAQDGDFKQNAEGLSEDESRPEDSDDDAPPEAFSKANAVADAKALRAAAFKAKEEEKLHARRRRQEREAKLQQQSKQLHRKASRSEAEAPQASRLDMYHGRGLPKLLPEDVLAAEPTRKSPGALEDDVEMSEADEAPPAAPTKRKTEMQIGSVNVKLLAQASDFLPPKPNQRSQSTKQSWLSGRAGPKFRSFDRKPFKTGFKRAK